MQSTMANPAANAISFFSSISWLNDSFENHEFLLIQARARRLVGVRTVAEKLLAFEADPAAAAKNQDLDFDHHLVLCVSRSLHVEDSE